MNAKARSLFLAAIVLLLSVAVWNIAAAQDEVPATERPLLGVSLQDTDEGPTIQRVANGSAADDAGLQVGDLITAVNGTAVTDSAEVAEAISALSAGDPVTIDFTRDGEQMSVEATLGAARGRGILRGVFGRGDVGIEYNSEDQSWTITNLSEDSALYTAGLREGDVIKTVDGSSYDPAGLFEYLATQDQDATATLGIERDGEAQDIQVAISDLTGLAMPFGMRGNMPDGFFRNFPNGLQFGMMLGGGRLGVAFVTLDEQTAQENDVTATEGALIQEVVENSPAAEAGLQVGDIITAVNGEAVDAEHTLRDRLTAYEAGDEITLAVLRDGASQDIPVTLGEPTDMMPGDFFHFFDGPKGFRFPGMPDGEVPVAPNL